MGENVWAAFAPFQAIPFTRRFLQSCYQRLGLHKAEAKSYRNSETFLFYLQHARRHYEQAGLAPLELQPLLLFYGMTQLVKACLLTADPDYPRTAAVLAHGVSTRKKKKKGYAFAEDEVKIQKHGLVTHVSNVLFRAGHLEGKKFRMKDLFERIPDLNGLYDDLYGRRTFYRIAVKNKQTAMIPAAILDDWHMALPRFLNVLQSHTGMNITGSQPSEQTIRIHCEHTLPVFSRSLQGDIYIPRSRDHLDGLPEMLVHFLLLYNLSMICRYETEWWSELFYYSQTYDLPLIESFLRLTAEKTPLLAAQFLRDLM